MVSHQSPVTSQGTDSRASHSPHAGESNRPCDSVGGEASDICPPTKTQEVFGSPSRGERGALESADNPLASGLWPLASSSRFKANRRGYYAALLLALLFTLSLFSELIANDRPLLVSYKGHLLFPALFTYTEKDTFGGALESEADYTDPWVIGEIRAHGWMLTAPIPYDYRSINFHIARAPAAPSAENWLGTDDQARDVLARILYGFRISMGFAMVLMAMASVIGITVGAVSGYFGGTLDIVLQRIIEIWEGLPMLFLLIILSAMVTPSLPWLFAIILLFRWMAPVDLVRAECLRVRNFDYVRAARALGLSELTILRRHVLPNALVSVVTYLPFYITGVITTLTSLDFLGFGLPPGSASLGELLAQGKNNPQSPWLGIIGFLTLAITLTLWVFVGEAVRDAFNPRKVGR